MSDRPRLPAPLGATVALAVALALTVSGCAVSGSAGGPSSSQAQSMATGATPSAATPTPQATALTGGPALAVKIDNTSPSRPRLGLDRADVVYVEPVEAGYTRLLAVFSSSMPDQVGPVRSARESDLDLLGNYGPVAFAFSGASAYTLGVIKTGTQVNVSYDSSRLGYSRVAGRAAPYNLVGDPAALLARAGGSTPPADVGLRFGAAATVGTGATSAVTAYPNSSLAFTWDPARQRYLLATDGRPEVTPEGTQVSAATVVLQTVPVRESANRDVNGIATPVASVVGQGPVTVLRDGQQWSGTWSRPARGSPTSLQSADGQPITLAATPVWVLLVPQGQHVTLQ